jgi:3-oxocholest-4-en-26-oyl-CoA dehydrogenase alpha subunit
MGFCSIRYQTEPCEVDNIPDCPTIRPAVARAQGVITRSTNRLGRTTAVEFELKYTEVQNEFRNEVRTWLVKNVPDGITARPRSFEESLGIYLKRRELGRKLGAKGWLYPSGERRYGGGGLDLDQIIVLEEETARLGLGLPPYYDSGGKMGSASIRVWGTEEQKQRFLPPIYKGEVRSWQLLTEPSAGSDLAGVRTTAIRDGDVYVVNGQKIYIGSHHGADRFWTIAVTDPKGKRHQNVSWFMIDASLPGITTQPLYMLSAQSEGETDEFGHKNIIFFDNVRVPADCLVGGENNGWKVASTHLEVEHSGQGNIRTNPVWIALLAHCRQHHRDGRPLIEDPDVRAKLAEIFSRLEAVRLLSTRNFWMVYAGEKRSYEGSQVSYLRKTTNLWLTKAILDLLGPDALTNDPILGAIDGIAEAQQRRGIVEQHPGGTTDIQRVVIARRLGVGNREPQQAGRLGEEGLARKSPVEA